MVYTRTNADGPVVVSKTERKSGSDGDEVITGGAKQQPQQVRWLGNNHIIVCTPSFLPTLCAMSPLAAGWARVM